MFFVHRNPSLQSTWHLQRSVAVCFLLFLCHLPFNSAAFCFFNFNLRFNLNMVLSCFLGNLQFLHCCNVLMTFSFLGSRHRSIFFLREIVLLIRLGLQLALLFLFLSFSPAVEYVLLACCWLCSSRLLFAVLFCHFVQLSEILVDLLLVVVQVLRLCAPFRQSGFASFVDFFSPLALLAVVLSLFFAFWRRLLQHYFVVVYCSDVRLKHLQRHNSALRHFVIIGSRYVFGILSTVVYNNVVCCL